MSIETIPVLTPIDLPKLVPDSWGAWWEVWNANASALTKVGKSPNSESGLHYGFDIIKPHEKCILNYEAKLVDISLSLPKLYKQITSIPAKIYGARFVESKGDFPPHIDNLHWAWSIRNMFYCEDPVSQWYFSDINKQNIKSLNLPEETNWFGYLDGAIKHGTKYNPKFPKIILQIFISETDAMRLSIESMKKFETFLLHYDIDTSIRPVPVH